MISSAILYTKPAQWPTTSHSLSAWVRKQWPFFFKSCKGNIKDLSLIGRHKKSWHILDTLRLPWDNVENITMKSTFPWAGDEKKTRDRDRQSMQVVRHRWGNEPYLSSLFPFLLLALPENKIQRRRPFLNKRTRATPLYFWISINYYF